MRLSWHACHILLNHCANDVFCACAKLLASDMLLSSDMGKLTCLSKRGENGAAAG